MTINREDFFKDHCDFGLEWGKFVAAEKGRVFIFSFFTLIFGMNWENFLIQSEDLFFFLLEDTMIWNNIYPAEAHKLERFRKVARKSEEVGPPCFKETSQHFGGTCKPATVFKGYRSTKSLGNPALSGPGNGKKLPKLGLHSKIKCFGFKNVLQ